MAAQKPFLTFVDPADVATPIATTPVAEKIEGLDQTAAMTNVELAPAVPKPVVRTYHQDMTRVMGQNNPRTMSTILQNVRQDEAVKESRTLVSPKNKLFLVASIMCILIGLGALGFVAYRNYATTLVLQQGQNLSLIQAETNTNVTLIGGETFKNRDRVRSAFGVQIPLETINNIFFTKQSITGLVRLGFPEMVGETGGIIPTELFGTLDGNFMYGTYQSSQTLPFLILRVTNYDDAFDGMRAWEPLMINHLGFLFQLPDALQATLNKSVFEDAVIANRTVRVVTYKTPQALPTETFETAPVLQTEGTPSATTDSSAVTPVAVIATETSGTDSSSNSTIDPSPEIPAQNTTIETTPVENPYQEGDAVLMYTFLNEKTILITTSDAVMQEILFRLTNAQLLL